MATSAEQGTIDEGTAAVLTRSLRVGERTADELMTPRVRVETLAIDDTVDDLLAAAIRTGFSRFPVVEGDLDDVRGVVHVKQAFAEPRSRRGERPRPQPHAHPDDGARTPSTATSCSTGCAARASSWPSSSTSTAAPPGSSRWRTSSRRSSATSATSTTAARPSPFRDAGPDSWVVSGTLRPDELAELVGWSFPDSEVYETLAGFLLAELGRIPSVGDRVTHDGRTLVVSRMDRRRIADVRIEAADPAERPARAVGGGAVNDGLALLAMVALLGSTPSSSGPSSR